MASVSSPGWYPDPAAGAGQGARWRWYDGRGWTAATAGGETAPALPPADPGGPAPLPRSTVRASGPWLLAIVGLVVLGLGAALIGWRAPRVSYVPPPGPGADTSARAEPARPPSACPVAVAGYRNPHPSDGRTYGGRLALPKSAVPYDLGPSGAVPILAALEDTQTWYITWQAGNRRQSGVTLGELRREGSSTTVQRAARQAMECMLANPVRQADVTASTRVTDAAVTISGRPGWQVVVDVTLNPAKQLGVTGERLVVVVVDDGRPDWLSALVATVRLDRPDLAATIDELPRLLSVVD